MVGSGNLSKKKYNFDNTKIQRRIKEKKGEACSGQQNREHDIIGQHFHLLTRKSKVYIVRSVTDYNNNNNNNNDNNNNNNNNFIQVLFW